MWGEGARDLGAKAKASYNLIIQPNILQTFNSHKNYEVVISKNYLVCWLFWWMPCLACPKLQWDDALENPSTWSLWCPPHLIFQAQWCCSCLSSSSFLSLFMLDAPHSFLQLVHFLLQPLLPLFLILFQLKEHTAYKSRVHIFWLYSLHGCKRWRANCTRRISNWDHATFEGANFEKTMWLFLKIGAAISSIHCDSLRDSSSTISMLSNKKPKWQNDKIKIQSKTIHNIYASEMREWYSWKKDLFYYGFKV